MGKILCFVSNEFADFEVTLALHLLRAIGGREIISVGCDLSPVVSQAGFSYLPNTTLVQAANLPDVEGLIIPGGPIRPQPADLSELICKLDGEQKLLAAICFGPQYLAQAGVLEHRRFTTSCSEAVIRSLQVEDPFPRQNFVEARVVQEDRVITAKGGAFVDFAFTLGSSLGIFAGHEDEKQRLYEEFMDRQPAGKVEGV